MTQNRVAPLSVPLGLGSPSAFTHNMGVCGHCNQYPVAQYSPATVEKNSKSAGDKNRNAPRKKFTHQMTVSEVLKQLSYFLVSHQLPAIQQTARFNKPHSKVRAEKFVWQLPCTIATVGRYKRPQYGRKHNLYFTMSVFQ